MHTNSDPPIPIRTSSPLLRQLATPLHSPHRSLNECTNTPQPDRSHARSPQTPHRNAISHLIAIDERLRNHSRPTRSKSPSTPSAPLKIAPATPRPRSGCPIDKSAENIRPPDAAPVAAFQSSSSRPCSPSNLLRAHERQSNCLTSPACGIKQVATDAASPGQ